MIFFSLYSFYYRISWFFYLLEMTEGQQIQINQKSHAGCEENLRDGKKTIYFVFLLGAKTELLEKKKVEIELGLDVNGRLTLYTAQTPQSFEKTRQIIT